MATKALIPALTTQGVPRDLEGLLKVEAEIDVRVKAFGQASTEFAPVVAILTIINDTGAWSWHVDEETSEPLYKSFRAYVEAQEWNQSVPRLYQLMSEYRKGLIEAAEDDPDAPRVEGINYDHVARTRSTGTSVVRFGETQSRALGRFVDNFEVAAHNVFESDPGRPHAIALAADVASALRDIKVALDAIVSAAAEAKAEAKAKAKAEKAAAVAARKGEPVDNEVEPDESDDSLA